MSKELNKIMYHTFENIQTTDFEGNPCIGKKRLHTLLFMDNKHNNEIYLSYAVPKKSLKVNDSFNKKTGRHITTERMNKIICMPAEKVISIDSINEYMPKSVAKTIVYYTQKASHAFNINDDINLIFRSDNRKRKNSTNTIMCSVIIEKD